MTDLENEVLTLLSERRLLTECIRDRTDPIGDVADEADAHARLEQLTRVDDRLAELDQLRFELKHQPVPAPDEVAVGLGVRLLFADGTTEVVSVVRNVLERSLDEAAVTLDSPLGRALLGAHVGDHVAYDAPAGRAEVEVLEIQPAAARAA